MALPDFLGRRSDEVASPSLPVSLVFVVAAVLGIGFLAGQWAVLVYVLSFWHYPIYALAFVFRKVSLAVFERDAVLMKAVSLVAFGAVYLTVTPDLLSLLVVGIGLLFNLSAARALGTDRTYYGYELAALPPKLITSFPYSVLSHPMLTGNAVAFAGTLLNDAFRAQWWPLAVAHVVLNLAVLVMEARARPRRLGRPALLDRQPRLTAWPTAAGMVGAGALLAGLAGGGPAFALGVALAVLAYGWVLLAAYAWPGSAGEGGKGREGRGG
jgi:protein-S-isoprenylcysteine O-methyltransferase Ste14